MSRPALIAIAVIALLVGLIARFPARVAIDWFAPAELQFKGVAGSVWQGSAAAVVLPNGAIEVSPLQWRLRPSALLRGRVAADIEAQSADASFRGETSLSLGGEITVSASRLSAPLEGLTTDLSIGQVFGQLQAEVENLVLVDEWPERLIGTVDIRALSYPALGLPALGDFRLICSDAADVPVYCDIGDTGGPLEVTGTLILQPDSRYELTGAVKARPGAPSQLADGLRFLGRPDAYGYYPIEQAGSLR